MSGLVKLSALATVCLLLAGARCTFTNQEFTTITDIDSSRKISATRGNFDANLRTGDEFGSAVAEIGDLEGDGVTDLAVGAPLDHERGTGRGAVWILFMDSDGRVDMKTKIADRRGGFTGDLDNDDHFGSAVANLGDLNGDGFLDLAVGAPLDDDGNTDRGAVWILFLNADGTVRREQKISNRRGGFSGDLDDDDHFGNAVANIGDLNGDGITDIAVGAAQDDDGAHNAGAVWILFLNNDGTVQSSRKISDTRGGFEGDLDNNDHFGSALAGIGDLDKDGVNDIAVGADQDDDGGEDRGAVWILFMDRDGRVKSDRKISQNKGNFKGKLQDGDRFGSALADVGDLDLDGVIELAVGAEEDDSGNPGQGVLWLLFMDTRGEVVSESRISGNDIESGGGLSEGDQFGSAVGAIRDLDADGVPDIAVGARKDNDGGTDTGAVWILFMGRAERVSEFVEDLPPFLQLLLGRRGATN
ncbi:MAG: integrin alpha [Gammaproteobacteria bacterium]|jgi:hypothetical protein